MRTRRRLIILACALTSAAVLALAARSFHRGHASAWPPPEDTGDYAGALDRPAPAYDPSNPPSRSWLDPKRAAPPPTTYHEYVASAIGGRRTFYLLYLPPGYEDAANAARRYPVVYWLHGYAAEPQYGTPFVEALEAAIRAGRCPPIIAVLPNGLHDSWYVDSVDGSQPVESIIVNDLIPHIDRNWRTIPDRRARAVEGFSMGGWGAAHLAFKYPNLFCAATLVSAPLHTHATFPQFQRIFAGNADAYYAADPVTRARRDAVRLRDAIRVRVLIGADDGNLFFARAFDRRLAEWQVPHDLTIVPGVGHSDADVYEKLGGGAFEFYEALFRDPQGALR